jgi:hypothetical protein
VVVRGGSRSTFTVVSRLSLMSASFRSRPERWKRLGPNKVPKVFEASVEDRETSAKRSWNRRRVEVLSERRKAPEGLHMEAYKTALERAFELAAAGRCCSIDELKVALKKEGYNEHQVTGRELKKQLKALIEEGQFSAR